jgi:hypothetical protein
MSDENLPQSVEPEEQERASEWLRQQLARLKQRKVSRVAITYSLALWLIVQIGDVGLPLFEVPESVLAYLVLAGVLGLPVAMVLAWLFEITPRGIVLDRRRRSEPLSAIEVFCNTMFLALGGFIACLLLVRIVMSDAAAAREPDEEVVRRSETTDGQFICIALNAQSGQLVLRPAKGPSPACPPIRLRVPIT